MATAAIGTLIALAACTSPNAGATSVPLTPSPEASGMMEHSPSPEASGMMEHSPMPSQ
ncbi:MAG: hypothetical protein ACRDGQ_02195 [Candidatus Limnocylindrales bacterium]